ncbi:hypothetical protein OSB04_023273 [Centaurea solstitialis]|uniref:GTD-binding domain-containing protein n=1 Tax=Centaurea solstitialis TaxID=347529 RepID=A0AA38SVN0_9ASTR|nr:hypothetical protein OSB04_023273 [Centaurea solstitialis]
MAALKGIMYHLSMAACEWFLMFLMLFDAALAYFLAKFANYCDLQPPCIFCLRLDHFFGNLFGHEKPRSYLKLFCHEHRGEVSCLVACEVHGRLADAREMCDDCFMSVMNCGIGTEGYRKPYLNKGFDRRPSSCGLCSCCETEWKPKPKCVRRSQPGAVKLGPAAKVIVKPPLPRVGGPGRGRFRRRNLFKRVRGKVSGNSTPRRVQNNARVKMEIDTLSDFGCVRFDSDSEFEVPVPKDVQTAEFRFYSDSDSDSGSDSRISVSKNVPRPRKKRGSKDKTRAKRSTHGVSDHETSLVDRHQNENTRLFQAPLTSKDHPIGHGSKEVNHVEHHSRNVFAPSMPEEKLLTSKGSIQDSVEHVELHSWDVSAQEKSTTSPGSFQDSIGHVEHHSRNVSPPSLPQEKSSIQDSIGQIEHHSRDVSGPSLHQEKLSTSGGSIQDSIGHVEISSRDVFEPSVPQEKSSTSRVSIQDSIGHVEHHSRDTSSSSLPTSTGSIQDSIGHVELHSSDVSGHPGSVSDQRKLSTDDLKGNSHNGEERSSPSMVSVQDSKPDTPKFNGFNDQDSSSSSDKSDDGFESPAGSASSVGDIEGETALEKLKRQVEHDRQRLHSLHMELEEERNHAAVAADEAMAMITRLQEEKAALHMEALQYLRMMDEQAEYDMEALDKANDLVAEKDKEIQDLEAELDFLRSRFDDEVVETGNFPKSRLGNGKTGFGNTGRDSTPRKGPVLDLQDEKRYILQRLSELERKLNQVSSVGKSNGIHTEMENLEDLDNGMQSKHKDSSTLNGSNKVDVGTLENEISDLNERLKALEADRDFLEHACNTLQANGGLEFIQEIAHHLQDMRRIRLEGGLACWRVRNLNPDTTYLDNRVEFFNPYP